MDSIFLSELKDIQNTNNQLPDLLHSSQPHPRSPGVTSREEEEASWLPADQLDSDWPPTADMAFAADNVFSSADIQLYPDLGAIENLCNEQQSQAAGGPLPSMYQLRYGIGDESIMTDDGRRRPGGQTGAAREEPWIEGVHYGKNSRFGWLLSGAAEKRRATTAQKAAVAVAARSGPPDVGGTGSAGGFTWLVGSYLLIPLVAILFYSQTSEFPTWDRIGHFLLEILGGVAAVWVVNNILLVRRIGAGLVLDRDDGDQLPYRAGLLAVRIILVVRALACLASLFEFIVQPIPADSGAV